jgi:hypothetical protein
MTSLSVWLNPAAPNTNEGLILRRLSEVALFGWPLEPDLAARRWGKKRSERADAGGRDGLRGRPAQIFEEA